MAKRKFYVTFTAEIAIDDKLLKSIDDEWRERFYGLDSDEQIAEHLAFNLAQNRRLATLDGFADRKGSEVTLVDFRTEGAEESFE
jgi:hypothetical protein